MYMYLCLDCDFLKPSNVSLYRDFVENLTSIKYTPNLYKNPIRKLIYRHRCRNPDKQNKELLKNE